MAGQVAALWQQLVELGERRGAGARVQAAWAVRQALAQQLRSSPPCAPALLPAPLPARLPHRHSARLSARARMLWSQVLLAPRLEPALPQMPLVFVALPQTQAAAAPLRVRALPRQCSLRRG